MVIYSINSLLIYTVMNDMSTFFKLKWIYIHILIDPILLLLLIYIVSLNDVFAFMPELCYKIQFIIIIIGLYHHLFRWNRTEWGLCALIMLNSRWQTVPGWSFVLLRLLNGFSLVCCMYEWREENVQQPYKKKKKKRCSCSLFCNQIP